MDELRSIYLIPNPVEQQFAREMVFHEQQAHEVQTLVTAETHIIELLVVLPYFFSEGVVDLPHELLSGWDVLLLTQATGQDFFQTSV